MRVEEFITKVREFDIELNKLTELSNTVLNASSRTILFDRMSFEDAGISFPQSYKQSLTDYVLDKKKEIQKERDKFCAEHGFS